MFSMETAGAIEGMGERLKHAEGQAWKWHNYAKQLEARLAEAQQQAQVNQATIAGLNAQLQAFAQAYPQSPLLQPMGNVYQNGPRKGQQKTKVRAMFEQAFDATLRKFGITNPLAHRDY